MSDKEEAEAPKAKPATVSFFKKKAKRPQFRRRKAASSSDENKDSDNDSENDNNVVRIDRGNRKRGLGQSSTGKLGRKKKRNHEDDDDDSSDEESETEGQREGHAKINVVFEAGKGNAAAERELATASNHYDTDISVRAYSFTTTLRWLSNSRSIVYQSMKISIY